MMILIAAVGIPTAFSLGFAYGAYRGREDAIRTVLKCYRDSGGESAACELAQLIRQHSGRV